MRFLVDANLSPVVSAQLANAGHDSLHVADLELLGASDDTLLATAADTDRVIVSADADFAALLALGQLSQPSLVLLRSADHLTPARQGDLILASLAAVGDELERGAIVTLARGRVRVRALPIVPEPR